MLGLTALSCSDEPQNATAAIEAIDGKSTLSENTLTVSYAQIDGDARKSMPETTSALQPEVYDAFWSEKVATISGSTDNSTKGELFFVETNASTIVAIASINNNFKTLGSEDEPKSYGLGVDSQITILRVGAFDTDPATYVVFACYQATFDKAEADCYLGTTFSNLANGGESEKATDIADRTEELTDTFKIVAKIKDSSIEADLLSGEFQEGVATGSLDVTIIANNQK